MSPLQPSFFAYIKSCTTESFTYIIKNAKNKKKNEFHTFFKDNYTILRLIIYILYKYFMSKNVLI
ncbi:hypothetical protein PFUGPA_02458 [Plasmodium falciparum Palo Alto/Uganda]|uniref:Uncharacterized protein n=2 Tax=Plasmodium falciparum TaxID=5833 RepID=W4J225_PLAFP|nr:hypothetical protein PFUGPA_02458 [Plasmodium falciparum Palo Alto/Uganda]EUR75558.1 hypothetical protein PFBG_01300 [Plasmodium falciparum 7G8]